MATARRFTRHLSLLATDDAELETLAELALDLRRQRVEAAAVSVGRKTPVLPHQSSRSTG